MCCDAVRGAGQGVTLISDRHEMKCAPVHAASLLNSAQWNSVLTGTFERLVGVELRG
jgi:hypothetical protein